ncbi:endonuclease/exonuclease/phosphatase family protein [Methylobacterium mesophilicum]|uniref:endonuclease/exonuclease/phosphatase family protein n=1 Tax=Methylobacterium mesophilicum TaxID=39956 RepID=UPI002F358B8A
MRPVPDREFDAPPAREWIGPRRAARERPRPPRLDRARRDPRGREPRPAGPDRSARRRDAQLYAAAVVLRERVEPGVIAGDLNATPWEIAVARMVRLSGLIDPRRDRGYVATWNARSSLWRWPLDHVFHEGGFETLSIERLDAFGSDHFPYLVRLCRRSGDGPASEMPREAGDVAAANAVLSAAGATERVQAR